MLSILVTSLHLWLIRNVFGCYVVAFMAWVGYEFLHGKRPLSYVELAGHVTLILLMGRLVIVLVPTSSLTSTSSSSTSTSGNEGSSSLFSTTTLFLCFGVATSISSFLLGMSVAKSMQKNNDGETEMKRNKAALDNKKFVLKAKSRNLLTPSPTPLDSSSSNNNNDSTPSPSTVSTPTSTPMASGGASAATGGAAGGLPTTGSVSKVQLLAGRTSGSNNTNTNSPLLLQAASSLTQPSKSATGGNPGSMDTTIDLAKQTMFAIIGLPNTNQSHYANVQWNLCGVGNGNSHIWRSKDNADGILLRGSSFTNRDAKSVLKYIYEQDRYTTGFDGLACESELSTKMTNGGNKITVRRLVCKSGSLMSSKRDFVVVTCISKHEQTGQYTICSRSMPEDFALTQKDRKGKGAIRGVVHTCGYILHPWKSGEGSGCEISYACHMDMMGSSTGHMNQSKVDPLVAFIIDLFEKLQHGVADEEGSTESGNRVRRQQADISLTSSFAEKSMSAAQSAAATEAAAAEAAAAEAAAVAAAEAEAAATTTKRVQPEEETCLDLTREQRSVLMQTGDEALQKLRQLHSTFRNDTRIKSDEETARRASLNRGTWEVFYEQDGITVREMSQSAAPMGVLSASCSTEAPPHVVRQLLLEHPDAVDGLLECRKILTRINPQTYVQWLAYGAIWPVGERDFLLVTTEDAYDHKTGDGFIIASTSIDHICDCEIDGDVSGMIGYTRSSLKLAGYVGVPNASGGTDVSLFVDVDVANYIPAWLLQVLAQYGLSEMMTRIQRATIGQGPAPPNPNNDLSRILNQIQSREAKMRQYVQLNSLPVPIDATFPTPNYADGGGGLEQQRSPRRQSLSREEAMARASSSGAGASLPPTDQGIEGGASSEEVAVAPVKKFSGGKYDAHLPTCLDLATHAKHLLRVYMGWEAQASAALGLKWEEKKNQKGIVIQASKVDGNEWLAVQGTASIKASKEDIMKLLLDDKRIGEFDDMFDSSKFLFQVDEKTSVRLMQFKAIWPTSPREFLVCTTWEELPDGSTIVCTRSASNEIMQQSNGYVRGFLQISGYLVQPYESFDSGTHPRPADLSPGGCRLTLTAHSELGGTLPTSIINMLSSAAPLKMLQAITLLVEARKR